MMNSVGCNQGKSAEDRAVDWLCRCAWIAALAALALLALWPLWAGMIACADDLNCTRGAVALRGGSPWSEMAYWWGKHEFRPIAYFYFYFTNLETLDSRGSILLHLPALAAMIAAIWVALRRLTPQYRRYFPFALLFLFLHDSTSVDLWQPDTVAQTWVAACGLWLGLAVWKAIETAWSGKSVKRQSAILVGLCLLGVLAKEQFYGWVAGVGILLAMAGLVAAWRRNWRVVAALGVLFLAVTALPLAYLCLRWFAGGLHLVASPSGTGRYHARFGMNLIYNTALGMAAVFTTGPIHVLRDPLVSPILRCASLLWIGLNMLICAGPWAMVRFARLDWPDRPCGKTVAAIGMVTFFGVAATLPMGRISELYLMGPNAGAAILFAVGLGGWWQLAGSYAKKRQSSGRHWGHAAVVVAMIAMVAGGTYGMASRAYHFRLTWSHSSTLNRILLDHQKSLPPDKDQVAVVYMLPEGPDVFSHSSYIMQPTEGILPMVTEPWLNYHDPQRRMKLITGAPTAPLGPRDLVVDTRRFPPRRHW